MKDFEVQSRKKLMMTAVGLVLWSAAADTQTLAGPNSASAGTTGALAGFSDSKASGSVKLRSMQPTRVPSAATEATTYQYDDDSFEEFWWVEDPWVEAEFAQRFTLPSAGVYKWAQVCLLNIGVSPAYFNFNVYVREDQGGLPGRVIATGDADMSGLQPGYYDCFEFSGSFDLSLGHVWVSVEWFVEDAIALVADTSNNQGKRAQNGRLPFGSYGQWEVDRIFNVYGIRLSVVHETKDPDPEPDPDPDSPPRAPTDVRVVPTDGTTVRVSWRDRSDDEDGFQVWKRLEGAGWSVAARASASIEQARVSGLRPGGRYQFFVRAFNADGHADSDPVAVTMPSQDPDPVTPPRAPADVSVVPTGGTTVRVSWRDRSDNEEGFEVWNRLAGAGWFVAAGTAADIEEAHVSGLRPGGKYRFFVRAFNADGHADSDPVAVTMPSQDPDPVTPPRAPADVSVVPTGGTTVRVSWRDRSDNEEGFEVWNRLAGAGWFVAAGTAADIEEAHVSGLRPGGKYRFFVRAFNADGHANSDHVVVTMREPGTLHDSRFGIGFSADANGSSVTGQEAGWWSDKGVLYWLFDPRNPEALVKVLDGRSWNGHWWFDLAVASDLRSVTRAVHRETGEEWVAITGFGKDVFLEPGESANRLVHCAFPASRTDNTCAVSGYGTTVSLRDAWDSSGRIPSSYFPSSFASVDASRVSGDLGHRRPTRAADPQGTAGLANGLPVPLPVPTAAAEPATLQGSQFRIDFSANANDSTFIGESSWSSDQGVLYWLFDPQNPEALVKVLDGRGWNGHWWFDLAVASDLRSVTRLIHSGTGDEWVAITGFGKDVFLEPGEAASRLVHCAFPASRAEGACAVSGYGTTVSLRDAWDSSGRIPSRHHE